MTIILENGCSLGKTCTPCIMSKEMFGLKNMFPTYHHCTAHKEDWESMDNLWLFNCSPALFRVKGHS